MAKRAREWTNKGRTEAMLINPSVPDVTDGISMTYRIIIIEVPRRYRVAFDRRSSTMRIIRWVYEIMRYIRVLFIT